MTDIHSLIAELQDLNPHADVDVCEVLPRRTWTRDDVHSPLHPNEHAMEFNTLLHRTFPDRVVKLYKHFIGENGRAINHLFKKDGLHPAPGMGGFLGKCIIKHLKRRPVVDFYESWPMPRFYQPGVTAPTVHNDDSYTSMLNTENVILGSDEVPTMGTSAKISHGKKKRGVQSRHLEVPASMCGTIIGKVC